MSEISVRHDEAWHVSVTRTSEDDWPDLPLRHTTVPGKKFRPDTLAFTVRRGVRPTVSVSGRTLSTVTGRPTAARSSDTYWVDIPAWAAEIVRAARAQRNLTGEPLERGDS